MIDCSFTFEDFAQLFAPIGGVEHISLALTVPRKYNMNWIKWGNISKYLADVAGDRNLVGLDYRDEGSGITLPNRYPVGARRRAPIYR
jgi:hypothetical protein